MNFKIKDFVLIGILMAIHFVVYAAWKIAGSMLLPGIGPIITGALFALLNGGLIALFLMYKVPKFGVLTLFYLVLIIIMSLSGMAYLPRFASIMGFAFLADVVAWTSKYQSRFKNAFAYGLTQFGITAGGFIPVWFFLDAYLARWEAKGISAEHMQKVVETMTGWTGIISLSTKFIAGFLGIYLAYWILAKHLNKELFAKQD